MGAVLAHNPPKHVRRFDRPCSIATDAVAHIQQVPRGKLPDDAEIGAVLRRQDHFWTVVYGDRTVLVRDALGLRYLELLLRHPGRKFHVTEVAAIGRGPDGAPQRVDARDSADVDRVRKAVGNALRRTITQLMELHSPLGLHLRNAVHTGTQCEYLPDRPIRWNR